jgi:cyclopropane fatty-acyl-phospholipid synthase-like methyltransferase
MRVLDAGCGTGAVTLALLDALEQQKASYATIDAFDLTPEMLASCQGSLIARGVTDIRLRQADVLALDDQLPPDWRDYDLILSAAMLEYLPKRNFRPRSPRFDRALGQAERCSS